MMKILDFPEVRQAYEYDCGANALQSVLVYYGIEVRESVLMKKAKTNKTGTSIAGIVKTAQKYGLKTASKIMDIDDIRKYIDKNIPVIAVMQAWTKKKKVDWKSDWKDGHYVVVIGYDKKRLIFEDPAAFERVYLTFKEFQDRWHDIDTYRQKYFNHGIAIYGKKPIFNPKKIVHMD